MRNYTKKFEKEIKKISWLPFPEILKETISVIIMSIILLIFLGGASWLLQEGFNSLMK